MTAEIQFEFVETSDAFKALEAEWRSLCSRIGDHHYFQSFSWQWQAWQQIAKVRKRGLCLLVGRSNGRVVLLWPLMRDGHQIRLLASDKVEYRDLVVEAGPYARPWMAMAWNAVKDLKGINFFLFQDVKTDSNLAQMLEANNLGGFKHARRANVIRLDQFRDWDDYARSLPKKLRSDQGRQWRRIAGTGGEVTFETFDSKDDLQVGLDWMFHHKIDWLKANEINEESFGSPEYRTFINSVVQDASDTGHLFFAKLSVGDTIVAAGLGYKFGAEFTFHMFTYDAAWENYSPARLLLENIIKWCFDNGVTTFDFMPGEESYKRIWASDEFYVTDYIIPITAHGWLVTKWHASGLSTITDNRVLQALYHWVPSGLRQKVSGALLAHREYSGRLRKL